MQSGKGNVTEISPNEVRDTEPALQMLSSLLHEAAAAMSPPLPHFPL
ncbi:MAG: hypothetical protein JWO82_1645, partial [Akkermansiaceae bacterium]|nr:hypothetical protein [Akkermansiaceae bacterium]